MTGLLLSVSDLFLTMGLPSIDESLDKLLVAMESFPKSAILGSAIGYARVIGLCLALCVGSYECWMMMLGRRAVDVYHFQLMDMYTASATGKGAGGSDKSHGRGQEQGGGCAGEEGG